jgi:hypothetical protein
MQDMILSKLVQFIFQICLLGALCGCVAVWGDSYNVAMQNDAGVLIEYDPAVVNMVRITAAAQTACERHGKSAANPKQGDSNQGIRTIYFQCV